MITAMKTSDRTLKKLKISWIAFCIRLHYCYLLKHFTLHHDVHLKIFTHKNASLLSKILQYSQNYVSFNKTKHSIILFNYNNLYLKIYIAITLLHYSY